MTIAQGFLSEFDNELRTTRSLLAIVPEAQKDWTPHPKSMTLGQLARHIVDMMGWIGPTMRTDTFDMAPPGGTAWVPPPFTTTAQLVEDFDAAAAAAREGIAATSDAAMHASWSLLRGGQTVMAMPRIAALRGMLLNHSIHHRGQLSVYLRMLDVPLPSIYGPTADTGR